MKTKMAIILSLFAFLTFADQKPRINNERLIVKIKQGRSLPALKFAKRTQWLFGGLYVLYSNDLNKLTLELRRYQDSIESVENDYYSGPKMMPIPEVDDSVSQSGEKSQGPFNDPKVGKIWSFNDADNKGISISKAYSVYPNDHGEEIIVAVVDTGVDYKHEDLAEVMWINPGEIPGNGIDDDENGYVDDIHGINTLERDEEGKATSDPMDQDGHGTHVSGTIGAKQNNAVGIAGIASHVKIMAIRTVPGNGDETDVDVAESYLYAARNGARIINCSFGKDVNEGGMLVKETIDYIGKEYGVLIVAAAGNSSRNLDESPAYPAAYTSENLLVVASTGSWGNMSYFSNFGKVGVDVAAPGSSIYSTMPSNKYASMSGTSMASPTTAGVAAEVLSRFPHLSPLELKQAIMDFVTPVNSFKDLLVTGGRIDLLNTIEGLL